MKVVPTFEAVAKIFIATYSKANNKPSEQEGKESILRVRLHCFANHRIDTFSVLDIDTLKAEMMGGRLQPQWVYSVRLWRRGSRTVHTRSEILLASGPAHVAAMSMAPQMHHATDGAHWSSPARTVAPTWKEGIARLVAEYR
jgi:hypothetical protein